MRWMSTLHIVVMRLATYHPSGVSEYVGICRFAERDGDGPKSEVPSPKPKAGYSTSAFAGLRRDKQVVDFPDIHRVNLQNGTHFMDSKRFPQDSIGTGGLRL
jgi:hypothetical protein